MYQEYDAAQRIRVSVCELKLQNQLQISFTLEPANSRVDRGNLVLRYSVTHSQSNFGGIVLSGGTEHRA